MKERAVHLIPNAALKRGRKGAKRTSIPQNKSTLEIQDQAVAPRLNKPDATACPNEARFPPRIGQQPAGGISGGVGSAGRDRTG